MKFTLRGTGECPYTKDTVLIGSAADETSSIKFKGKAVVDEMDWHNYNERPEWAVTFEVIPPLEILIEPSIFNPCR